LRPLSITGVGKTFIRKTSEDEWVYASVEETLKKAHLATEFEFSQATSNLQDHRDRSDLLKADMDEPSLVQSFLTLWAQYNWITRATILVCEQISLKN
jgi:hypothetical protein